ncbi:MAG TPA: BMP family ABC transporter substrate-binding protein, partial [Bradyrhizobium sp.]|nr:BMP family ABC transporter substrate-binding protein [Bradyrhizobium sp.]
FWQPALKVAKQFPNVKFEHATGYKRADNLATYNIRFYEGRYIQGVIAGKMSKSGIVGYVGSVPIPEVIMGMNSFIQGMRSVNPAGKIKMVMINAWYDPGKEADAAKALIDQGADIVAQHTDSPAAMKIAAERGKLAFGQDSEMIKFGPTTQLTSIIDNWAPYYIARVKAELDGTWKEEDTWGGLKSQMVVMAPFTNMPDDVKKLAEDTKAAIIDGKLLPFKCPVVDQDGKTVECKGGDHLDDGQVLGMHFYVKGVDDKMPAK